MNEKVMTAVLDAIAEVAGVERDRVVGDADLDDLGVDSLTRLELDMRFNREFGIDVEEAEWGQTKTVGDVVATVERHLPQA